MPSIAGPSQLPLILVAAAAGAVAGAWLDRVAMLLVSGTGASIDAARSSRGLFAAANALLWLVAAWGHGASRRGMAVAALTSVLLLILLVDWRHHLIFDGPIVAGLVLAFGAAALVPHRPQALLWSLGGAVGAGVAFFVQYSLLRRLYGRVALGSGDVLLAALIGAATGEDTARALFIGALLGGSLALLLLLLGRAGRRDPFPYGSCLAAGAILTLLLP